MQVVKTVTVGTDVRFSMKCIFIPSFIEHLQSLWKAGTGHPQQVIESADGRGAVIEYRNWVAFLEVTPTWEGRGQSAH